MTGDATSIPDPAAGCLGGMMPRPDGHAPWQLWSQYVGDREIQELVAAYRDLVAIAARVETVCERAMRARVPVEQVRCARVNTNDAEDEVLMGRSGYQQVTDILLNLSDCLRVAAGEGPDYGHMPAWAEGVLTFDSWCSEHVDELRAEREAG